MLKTVFIGSKNAFDEMLVHWLSQRTDLVGVVWTQSTAWQRTWQGRLQFARKRWRRYGTAAVVNETLFYFYYHAFQDDRAIAELKRQIIDPYWERHGAARWQGDSIFTENVNSPEVQAFISERQPDVALAMCINNFFGKTLRQIPRLGILLWHEGITPEYKGLYSPFWAVHNLDFDRIGYTLLRMNDEYDAGEIFIQGRAENIDPFRHPHSYIGHKAIADSLGAVETLMRQLEAGTAEAIARPDARPQYYTYPGITDLIRQRLRLRRAAQSGNGEGVGGVNGAERRGVFDERQREKSPYESQRSP
jgi:hypothetical protein